MRVHEGGGLYGFCPGKATWDQEAVTIFEVMTVATEQKALLNAGGIAAQPGWFINLLSWFGPAYDMQKFVQKARLVMGDGSKKVGKKKPSGKTGK